MNEEKCKKCGKQLDRDDIGLTRKLINRGSTEFFCVECLAEHFSVTPESLRERIEFFRRQGCTLFL